MCRRVTARGRSCRRVTARGLYWRRVTARASDAENSGGAWRRVEGPMKTKIHRKEDRSEYVPMTLTVDFLPELTFVVQVLLTQFFA